jgi:hypothetical protein
VKLIPRRIFTKSFKKSKNSVRSYDAAQNRFVPRRDKWAFRG